MSQSLHFQCSPFWHEIVCTYRKHPESAKVVFCPSLPTAGRHRLVLPDNIDMITRSALTILSRPVIRGPTTRIPVILQISQCDISVLYFESLRDVKAHLSSYQFTLLLHYQHVLSLPQILKR